ncbi:SNU66/SART1 family [Parasponia andersonii]|uniref:SNU66/SART1 family n=1 Tax=Parasponia andersonii TaxID=3476 RepID=A0A2P5E495_PARAD|nr:SNU66/SART1 family [Parasponia andersonii]
MSTLRTSLDHDHLKETQQPVVPTSSLALSKEIHHQTKVHTFDRIHIERKDEFGRTLTPNEAFKLFCHEFHGIRPGKKKQEKTGE